MILVNTIYGEMDEALLVKKVETLENDKQIQIATEYWLKDEMVHRSSTVEMKTGLALGIAPSSLG